MTNIKISALIFTRNEAKVLKGLLENIKSVVDEIVVIDGCSTDETVDIALRYGATVYQTKPLGHVEPCRMYGLSKVSYDYVLYIDADERLNGNLKRDLKKIVKFMQEHNIVAARVLRLNFLSPKKVSRYLFYPDFQVRILNKGFINYKGVVHEQPIIRGKALTLPSDRYYIYHYVMNTYTLKGYKSKLIKYAYLAAMERLDKGSSRALSLALPLSFIMRFIKYYLLWKGFLDGIEGLYATLAYITYLQIVDFLKAFRPRKWDKIATLANSYGLTFLCKPASCIHEQRSS
jgi:(heptosyl)LPS beta-1,4-glucosyltransferase